MPLPQVLAGPIVRRVVGNEVAVWLALRDPAIVELVVWAGPQRSTGPGSVDSGTPPVARGIALTERFGAQLHVAVVVAEASAIIAPGAIHSYDVIVGGQGLRDLGLLRDEAPTTESAANARPLRLALGYELDRLPSFVTPAPTISDLVLVQGSCRRTNAAGPDAMAYLDDLIAEHRLDLTRRPQQLFLTGDQIYADDLSGCLLPQINAIGRELLGFTETLPIDNRAVPVTIEEFPVQRRRKVVREIGRFSTNDGLHHLLSYGELLAMHLLVWSPSLWRPLTTADEVFVPSPNVEANHLSDWEAYYAPKPGDPDPDGLTKWERTDEPEFTKQLKADRDLPGRSPPGRAGAGQHGHLHDLRRPRGHRRLVPVAVLAVAGAHRTVRPGDRPQRLRRLCGVPGLGQRPVGVHPHRRAPQAEERGAARHPRVGRDRRRVQRHRHRQAGAAARPHEAGHRPRGAVRLHGPGTAPPRARRRHPNTAHLPGAARAAEAVREQPRHPTSSRPAHRRAGAAGRRLAGADPDAPRHRRAGPAAGVGDLRLRYRTPSARPRPITTVRPSAGRSASTSRAGAATRSRSTPSCAGSPPTRAV